MVELVSYVFCFHGLMCGPFCFYKDYTAFIDGSNYAGGGGAARVPAAATGNGVSSGGGIVGIGSLSSGASRPSHVDDDKVPSAAAVADGRPGNNSHRRVRRLATPPSPGVLY